MDKVGLKIGGSVATYKGVEEFPLEIGEVKRRTIEFINRENNERIARYEIFPVIDKVRICILGFGVGPFGHYLVKRWNELKDKNVVHKSVSHYCSTLVKLYRELGLPVEYDEKHSPRYMCFYENDRLNIDKLSKWADELQKKGKIPVTHGDMVPEKNGKGKYDGFEVASADQLVPQVAIKLKAKRIVAGTDVDGLFLENPKINPKTKVVQTIRAYEKFGYSKIKRLGADVTGGLPKKVENFQEPAKYGIEGYIVNALVEGRIKNALLGKEVYGTLILP
jgi:isopentenyl phosphate kinase